MNRTIYNFYCYQCLKQNIAVTPYPLDTHNGKIDYIFCPNCGTWIHYSNTNLSTDRYKLVHINNWEIIDEDSQNPHPIYAVKNYAAAKNICKALNDNTVSINKLYDDCSPFLPVQWYLSHFHMN